MFPFQHKLYFVLLILCANLAAAQQSEPKDTSRIFLIGNSLTWDTLPGLLEGQVEWHVDCGKNLQYIYENPDAPCVKSSTPWDKALADNQYDILCIQPHFGTSIEDDSRAICSWVNMQPKAKLIIHTGWNRYKDFSATYRKDEPAMHMTHCPHYFDELKAQIRKNHPDVQIETTQAIASLDEICCDIEKGAAPISTLGELYRDEIHMDQGSGRYLMHNLMRLSLNQPVSDRGFKVSKPVRSYLDSKLANAKKRLVVLRR